MEEKIDVFISRKSADALLAKELYFFLKEKGGLNVFESDETLPAMGNSDYRKAIDKALDDCTHMIVVASSIENIMSSWVEAEWGFFIAEKRADRKKGNILTVITGNLAIDQLPPSLRNYEVIYFDAGNFSKVLAYTGKNFVPATSYKKPKSAIRYILQRNWLLLTIILIGLVTLTTIYIYYTNQPFDFTIFTKTDEGAQLNTDYPAFKGGSLTVFIGNKREDKGLLPDGEAVLKQVPASYFGKKVAVKLSSKAWKAAVDSIVIEKTVMLPIVPDGSLGTIFGRVMDEDGHGLAAAKIAINNNDTVITADKSGVFRVTLPYRLQKEEYRLKVSCENFKDYTINYMPRSGSIDIPLMRN